MYLVEVVYQYQADDTKTFSYKVDDRIDLYVGCKVVVPVGDHCTFKVATVRKIVRKPELRKDIHYRWVVQRVDFSVYSECVSDS